MNTKFNPGQKFPPLQTKNIHGKEVSIPSTGLVHLQFRRFAGCPICNLHLRSFVKRNEEIVNAGVKEIVVFHSSDKELLPYQGEFPFDVIGDPARKFYRQYAVETSLSAVLNPGAWSAVIKGNLAKDKPKMVLLPNGGILGLPAEFFIGADGVIKAVHYGKHADDHWSVDDVIALAKGSNPIVSKVSRLTATNQ
jgi:peroxiredoxin